MGGANVQNGCGDEEEEEKFGACGVLHGSSFWGVWSGRPLDCYLRTEVFVI